MTDNPLAGLRIVSLAELSQRVVDMFGNCVLDLSQPLQRDRLRRGIESALRAGLDGVLERTLIQAQEKAIRHVFRLMQDADYQAKRRARLKASLERQKERRQQAERERAAKARAKISEVKPVHGKVIVQ